MEGNQMKMRESLVLCLRIIGENGIRGNVFIDDIREAHRAITAALAESPRNCDVFNDAESARQAWLNDKDNWDDFGSPELYLHEWLFAHTKPEAKGEGDGR